MANSKDQVVIALECKGEKPIGVVSCRRKKCKVWGSGFTPDNKHMFD